MKRLITLFVISLFAVNICFSQYLTVSRSANIKERPVYESPTLEKVKKGDMLVLLDNGNQTDGYYRVNTTDGSQSGWIYRTLVRRHDEPLPEELIQRSLYAVVSTDINWEEEIPADYYEGTEDLSGDELKSKLNEIIKGHKEYKYTADTTDVWDILKETDQDPNNPDNVVLIYSGFSTNAAQEYNSGKGWEREHTWSQSHGQFGRDKGPGTDVHHLRPIKREFNGFSGKSNKDFTEDGEEFLFEDNLTGCLVSDSTWAPIDKFRGDVARMMFYMVVRYEGNDSYPDLELVDDYTMNKLKDQPVYGKLSILLKWHQEDPVDDWERKRNDIIYEKYQGNRNPFIDHPEYVLKIWNN